MTACVNDTECVFECSSRCKKFINSNARLLDRILSANIQDSRKACHADEHSILQLASTLHFEIIEFKNACEELCKLLSDK